MVISAVFADFPELGKFSNPWYFPSIVEYAQVLDNAGFEINYLELMPRPTPLKTGIYGWLKVFAQGITNHLNSEEQDFFIAEVEKRLKPIIFSEEDGWLADYVRLRFKARKLVSK